MQQKTTIRTVFEGPPFPFHPAGNTSCSHYVRHRTLAILFILLFIVLFERQRTSFIALSENQHTSFVVLPKRQRTPFIASGLNPDNNFPSFLVIFDELIK